MERHTILEGRVHVYRRPNSSRWHCATSIDSQEHRSSTRQTILEDAKRWAEDWYFNLRGMHRAGGLRVGKNFTEAAVQFMREYEVITEGQRSRKYVQYITDMLRVTVLPFFKDMFLADITGGVVQEYRVHRAMQYKEKQLARVAARRERLAQQGLDRDEMQQPPALKPLSRSAIANELIIVRQVLKTALRHKWIETLPDLSMPYKTAGKVGHRAWFSPTEYKQLYTATRKRARNPRKEVWRHESEQLHDFVLFMANTGLRPDEAWRLEYRDVQVVRDAATGQVILEIEVRGKRGIGYCKSMPGAVSPFRRLRKRNTPGQADRIFPSRQRELFNSILEEQGLKFDRDGKRRTAYSLRHTYICFRLMEGADIYALAKNCRTSVEMIEKHYAIHLKNTLDAASINVRRTAPVSRPVSDAA
jgi:integrase